jgi:hypothetical protein
MAVDGTLLDVPDPSIPISVSTGGAVIFSLFALRFSQFAKSLNREAPKAKSGIDPGRTVPVARSDSLSLNQLYVPLSQRNMSKVS